MKDERLMIFKKNIILVNAGKFVNKKLIYIKHGKRIGYIKFI